MNKFYNVMLLAVFFPTMFLAIIVGLDVPIPPLHTTGAHLMFRKEAMLLFGACMLFLSFRRSSRRWVAMSLVNQHDRYSWNTIVSKERVARVKTYNFMEAIISIAIATGLYALTSEAWLPSVVLLLAAIDHIVFVLYGVSKDKFRVGMTSKALLAGDRDVVIIYFLGLRKISFQAKTVFFDFKEEGMQFRLPIDLIPEDKREEFFEQLKKTVDRDKVYISNNI